MKPGQRFITLSPALYRIPNLQILLNQSQVSLIRYPWSRLPPACDGVLVWGNKPSAAKGVRFAAKHNLPVIRLEDGFLRSVDLGMHSAPYSIAVDSTGIYYDAKHPSDIERFIKQPLTEEQERRAHNIIKLWCAQRVSKYNRSREALLPNRPYVLVVDQTYGDASISDGLANASCFKQMLVNARERFPNHLIVLKTHPDVFAGKKRGHFDELKNMDVSGIHVLAEDIHAPCLLEHASAVFCVTSQMGFEALMWQKPVYTFGMPFYAGWGLTHDALKRPQRRSDVTLTQLVHAALIDYVRYIDPETDQCCHVEDLIRWMGMQRRGRERFAANLYLGKVPRWKKNILRQFFQGSNLIFGVSSGDLTKLNDTIHWGFKPHNKPGIQVEDGFIRSVGLGADLTRPASWVIDTVGMYYDATITSGLEQILQHYEFSSEELIRAKLLRENVVSFGVSKYNVGKDDWKRPTAQRVILVPGQVETDSSIKRGSPVLTTNLELLQAVRQSRPDDYIVYKPHPDVVAGLRKAGKADIDPELLCDEVILDQDMAHLLGQIDEVHTLTSLTGFEALLRGVSVHCYGQPFYSGWGLTHDHHPCERRKTKRSLDELVFATLVLYPTYISYKTGYFTSPERVLEEIRMRRVSYSCPAWWRPILRKLLSLKRF